MINLNRKNKNKLCNNNYNKCNRNKVIVKAD